MIRPFYYSFNTLAFMVGLAVIIIGLYPFFKAMSSNDWPYVEGTIVSAKLIPGKELGVGVILTHRVQIQYQYIIRDGHLFRSNRIEFGFGSRSFFLKEFAYRMLERYPEGKLVRVYFNPDRPADAVLERAPSMGSSVVWIVFGLLLLVTGLFVRFSESEA
ncbi:MAG: DUF3592 domain-containing protein [Magnetococcales bacterium]|nr:DUF3592 domain-containing protein [Magnetococcales bacterium]